MSFCVFLPTKNFLVFIQIRNWHTLKIQIQVETKFEWPKYDSTEKFVKFCPNKKNNKNDYDLGHYKESIYPYIPRQIMNEVELISPDPPVWLVGRVK